MTTYLSIATPIAALWFLMPSTGEPGWGKVVVAALVGLFWPFVIGVLLVGWVVDLVAKGDES